MADSTILSLAVLKANWDLQRRDYLDNFVALAAECIKRTRPEVVSETDLKAAMKAEFGLIVPVYGVRNLINRLHKRKFLTRQNRSYTPNHAELDKLNFKDVQARAVSAYEELIGSLRSYANEVLKLSWNARDAELALQDFLKEQDVFILSVFVENSVIPGPEYVEKGSPFVVGSFVKHIHDIHASAWNALEMVVKGHMLANAIFLPEPGEAARKFKRTTVYIDTSILIYALGYAGKAKQIASSELLTLLYETGADLRCFRHTFDETRAILDKCGELLRAGDAANVQGPVRQSVEFFTESKMTPSDIELLAANLEKNLGALRIRVVNRPPYEISEKEYVIGEEQLSERLSQVFGSGGRRVERDVASISAIMRLRRGREYRFVEECRAVFVTGNPRLVREANAFIRQDEGVYAVGPAISDFALTNLLWLKKPNAGPDLPRHRIIADCLAATQPNEQLWRRYLVEVDKLRRTGAVTADDVYLLRDSLEAKSELMRLTLGDEEMFTEGSVPEILERVKEELRQTAQQELRHQLREQAEATEKLARLHAAGEARELERVTNIERVANSAAHKIAVLLQTIMIGILSVGWLLTFPWHFPSIEAAWFRYSASLLVVAFDAATLLHLIRGGSIKVWFRDFETRIARRIFHWLSSLGEERPRGMRSILGLE